MTFTIFQGPVKCSFDRQQGFTCKPLKPEQTKPRPKSKGAGKAKAGKPTSLKAGKATTKASKATPKANKAPPAKQISRKQKAKR